MADKEPTKTVLEGGAAVTRSALTPEELQDTVTMFFPQKVTLAVSPERTLTFQEGPNKVPKNLLHCDDQNSKGGLHWYLKAHGVRSMEGAAPAVTDQPNPERDRAVQFLVSLGETKEKALAMIEEQGLQSILDQAVEAAKTAESKTGKGKSKTQASS